MASASALLRAVLDGAASTFTFASSEPAAQAIYAREGMAATWSLATMHGRVPTCRRRRSSAHDIDVAEAVRHERQRRGIDHRRCAALLGQPRPDTRVLGRSDGETARGIAVVHVVDGVAHVEHLVADRAVRRRRLHGGRVGDAARRWSRPTCRRCGRCSSALSPLVSR